MSDLINRLNAARRDAAEQVVVADLRAKGLADAPAAAQSVQHTPGPWEAYTDCTGRCCWLIRQVGEEGEPGKGVTWPETSEADARRIVQCVNAHDELVAALQGALESMKTGVTSLGVIRGAEAALRKATPLQGDAAPGADKGASHG